MFSDAKFKIPTDESIRDHFELLSSPIYYYYFAYRGSSSFTEIFGDPNNDYGVCHADDLQYLFPVGEQLFKDTPLSENDEKMVDVMTRLWSNFARTGCVTSIKL